MALPASAARVGHALALAAASRVGKEPSRLAGRYSAAPRCADTRESNCDGPMPRLASKPFFISTLITIGPAVGCAPSQTRMSSRQEPRSLLAPPVSRSAGVVALTQALLLLVG